MNENLGAAALYALEHAKNALGGKALAVLTGAGISTDSGIPDYRGQGKVARHPMTFDIFMGSPDARVRYWARSFVGWSRISDAEPNAGHIALAEAEKIGSVQQVITQNVDQLHQRAGSTKVIDLHGRLDLVKCVGCGFTITRVEMDELLQGLNPGIQKDPDIEFSPDGDAEIEAVAGFRVPTCPKCQGVLKPDVVFFGENVPVERVEQSMAAVDRAEVLLVVGTSLAVNSGFRFARQAAKAEKPIIVINVGPTKADDLATVKLEVSSSVALPLLLL
jgi:NAD-dependent SIR2 family protein deacetylase